MTLAIENRIAKLENMLTARKGKLAYRESIPMIEAELKRLCDGLQRQQERE